MHLILGIVGDTKVYKVAYTMREETPKAQIRCMGMQKEEQSFLAKRVKGKGSSDQESLQGESGIEAGSWEAGGVRGTGTGIKKAEKHGECL